MSIERLTYCGPYIECKVETIPSTYPVDRCSNAACTRHTIDSHAQGKFCHECGSAIAPMDIAYTEDAVDACELAEELADKLWRPFCNEEEVSDKNIHVWVGCESDDALALIVDNDEESLTELRQADIESQLNRFRRSYKKELALFRARYGAESVTVKWGILHTVS
jgi:hypothetical protein